MAYTGAIVVLSHVPWLGHEGLSSFFLSEESREGKLGLRETCEYGGCNTSMPVALASDLCLLSVPHTLSYLLQKGWGGSSLASAFHSFSFYLLIGLVSPQASQRSGGWKGASIYCNATALSNLGRQIQQIIVVF